VLTQKKVGGYASSVGDRACGGVLVLSDDQQVIRFLEQPEKPPSTWLCPPVCFLLPAALGRIADLQPRQPTLDAPGSFVSHLVQHEPVFALRAVGQHYDIGAIDDFDIAHKALSIYRSEDHEPAG